MEGDVSEEQVDGSRRLTVPSSRVAADIVEGEAVIINLQTGAYYTTDGVGCDAWELLASGRAVAEVVEALRDRYDADDGAIEAYVDEFTRTVLSEGLMHVLDSDDPAAPDADPVELPVLATKLPFEPADFVSYHDMKGLLLLDPIHEVDPDSGWPHAAAGG